MPGKGGDYGSKMINALAGAAAAYVARKAIGFAWTKVTGRQPPDSEERQAGLGEAVAWAVVIGAGSAWPGCWPRGWLPGRRATQ